MCLFCKTDQIKYISIPNILSVTDHEVPGHKKTPRQFCYKDFNFLQKHKSNFIIIQGAKTVLSALGESWLYEFGQAKRNLCLKFN